MQEQPRILGLDIGDKRIGVAVSDGLGLTAQPVFTLHRSTPHNDIRSIARLARKHHATAIVAGHPLHLSGDLSPQAKKNQRFAEELAKHTGLPLHLWDERLSSQAAHEILNTSGFGTAGRKEVIDQVAAAVILQGFLDARHGANQIRQHDPD
jgi:putative Holliday junction resolvase